MDPIIKAYHTQLPTVVFEGVKLPYSAALLDHLDAVPNMPEKTGLWFWRFMISVGGRTAPAREVKKHAEIALQLLTRQGQSLPKGVIHAEIYDAQKCYQEWTESLEILLSASKGKTTCRWEVEPYEIPDAVRGPLNPPITSKKEVRRGPKRNRGG